MTTEKPILTVLSGRKAERIPFWFMRQAGRYLPEYRAVRAEAGGFLNLALDPVKAAEVTIQPLRRYGMDAAILFSDILMVPMGLGQDLKFETGEGPVLGTLSDDLKFDAQKFDAIINPVYETVRRVRAQMKEEGFHETALIGFAGSPWTVACYMIEGGSSKDFTRTKKFAADHPEKFSALIDTLCDATIHYLGKQIEAGAEVLQLFDSWSGLAADDLSFFEKTVIEPTKKIVSALRTKYPHIPVIGFPRGAKEFCSLYADQTGIQALGLDQGLTLDDAQKLSNDHVIQGHLDPELLLTGGAALEEGAKDILTAFGNKPFIFNLGHGINKETPPENVALLSEIIKSWR